MISAAVEDHGLLLEQFADYTPDVFFMYTADWEELLFINESYEEIWGQSVEALREDPSDFLAGIHPEFHEMVLADMERLSAGESVEHEYRVNPDEEFGRWVRAVAEPVYEDGEQTRIAGFVRDITDQRRREDQLREREAVLREIYDVTADSEETFEDQVAALLAIGCEALDTPYGTLSRIEGEEYVFEVVESADDSVEAGDVAPLSATNCERTVATRETVVLGDVAADAPELTEKAGFDEWGVACYLGAPVVVDGDVYGTFCFYGDQPRDAFSDWDVTLVELMGQWVSYELTRLRTREELERQNDQLAEFASIVSHDLRNPLNVASGRLELARRDRDSEHLAAVAAAVERMETLVEDLLTLAREGEPVRDAVPVALEEAVERSWSTVDTGAATLRVEADVTVRADRSRLSQLLENLFRNAVEHAGEDVTVTVSSLPDGFIVADDGPGIPADERDAVFENGYSTSSDGTGFGLSIVRDVAAAHGWAVGVTESAGGGARFEITGVEVPDA